MDIDILDLRLVLKNTPIKAFVDVRISNLIIRDFRVVKENGRRPYVRVPYSTYKDHAGQLKFRPIVILPDEVRGEIDLAILSAYLRETEKRTGGKTESWHLQK